MQWLLKDDDDEEEEEDDDDDMIMTTTMMGLIMTTCKARPTETLPSPRVAPKGLLTMNIGFRW